MLDSVFTSRLRLSALVLLLPVLAACSKSFVVTNQVPQPLIERLPVSAKMVYSDEFKDYVYIEKGEDRALDKVDFGSAQVGLFNRVFGDLLTLVDGEATHDLKIEPQILDFQYSIPSETKLNMYEIWLKYRLKITDGQDAKIADWVVKGYGKTPTSMLGSHLKAFDSASNIALRDVGAQLALGFDSQPSIEDYLSGQSKPNHEDETGESERAEPIEVQTSSAEDVDAVVSTDTDAVTLTDNGGGAKTASTEIPEGEDE